MLDADSVDICNMGFGKFPKTLLTMQARYAKIRVLKLIFDNLDAVVSARSVLTNFERKRR